MFQRSRVLSRDWKGFCPTVILFSASAKGVRHPYPKHLTLTLTLTLRRGEAYLTAVPWSRCAGNGCSCCAGTSKEVWLREQIYARSLLFVVGVWIDWLFLPIFEISVSGADGIRYPIYNRRRIRRVSAMFYRCFAGEKHRTDFCWLRFGFESLWVNRLRFNWVESALIHIVLYEQVVLRWLIGELSELQRKREARGTHDTRAGRVLQYTSVFAIYQIMWCWKICKYYFETDELPNPRPTLPKK